MEAKGKRMEREGEAEVKRRGRREERGKQRRGREGGRALLPTRLGGWHKVVA